MFDKYEDWIIQQQELHPELTYDEIYDTLGQVLEKNPGFNVGNLDFNQVKNQLGGQNVPGEDVPNVDEIEDTISPESRQNGKIDENVQVEGNNPAKTVDHGQSVHESVHVPFNPTPVGHQVTAPIPIYSQNKEKGNVWIRQSEDGDNAERVVMIQFSNKLFLSEEQTLMDRYYNKIYEVRDGYDRPDDFWEIPMWQANVKATLPNADTYVVRDMNEAVKFVNNSNYKQYLFSVLDINKDKAKELAKTGKNVGIGGYADMTYFDDLPNVKVYEDVEGLAKDHGQEFVAGSDYNMFKGTPTIPRLQMSTGCSHHCAFCCISDKVEEKPQEYIQAQVESMRNLDAKFIYLDDKTFGQARSYKFLKDMYKLMKEAKPEFEGFIIQTTALMMRNLNADFLAEAGIKQIELGVESYNDAILRKYKKPATEKIIDEAVAKIREAGIIFIPNIIIGFPEETEETYQHTLDFLKRNEDVISHMNITHLAIYEGTELEQMIETHYPEDDQELMNNVNQNTLDKPWLKNNKVVDSDDNRIDKSWLKNEDNVYDMHKRMNDKIYEYGLTVLDKVPYANKLNTKVGRIRKELIRYLFN